MWEALAPRHSAGDTWQTDPKHDKIPHLLMLYLYLHDIQLNDTWQTSLK
jgi:hypothetical protein